MKDLFLRRRVLQSPGELRRHYDVVIVGGGSQGLAVDGGHFAVQVNGRPVEMRVRLGPFLDPSGERVRA